jgi:uncharacterized protein YbjT (DUF2867 family)
MRLDGAMTSNTDLTLVIGGTGKTGRRVAERLRRLGRAVRIGSRAGDPPFDWDRPGTWPAALDGVASAYLTFSPDLAFPGAADAIGGFARMAAGAGVERLVLLSGRDEEEVLPSEAAVTGAGVAWTVLRASWFAQNFSEHFLLPPVLDGVIALPGGAVAEPFVDAEDLADVAVAALTEPGHDGRIYELTGPRCLTFDEVAAELSAATGRQIRYVAVTTEEFAEVAVSHGVPAEEAWPLAQLFARVLDGRNAHATTDVADVLGRPPRDFTDYVREVAATGVWDVAERAAVDR